MAALPHECTTHSIDDTTVYRYENEHGDTSAIAETFVDRVERIFGYDASEVRSHIRVAPEKGPAPVLFTDPESDAYIAIAPRIE